jgi:hypothetical protein
MTQDARPCPIPVLDARNLLLEARRDALTSRLATGDLAVGQSDDAETAPKEDDR